MKVLIACCMVYLPLKTLWVTSPYGYRVHPLTGTIEYHSGVDLRANYDTVYAVLDGVVRSSGTNASFGRSITLQHQQVESIYGHLSTYLVNTGDTVVAGQAIAISGNTGHVTAPHLHFSIRYQKRYLNPLNFLYEILKTTDYEQKF